MVCLIACVLSCYIVYKHYRKRYKNATKTLPKHYLNPAKFVLMRYLANIFMHGSNIYDTW